MRTEELRTGGGCCLLRLALSVLPARRHAVVAGFPDEEGNSVDVAPWRGAFPCTG